jgi:hypothetical protein
MPTRLSHIDIARVALDAIKTNPFKNSSPVLAKIKKLPVAEAMQVTGYLADWLHGEDNAYHAFLGALERLR